MTPYHPGRIRAAAAASLRRPLTAAAGDVDRRDGRHRGTDHPRDALPATDFIGPWTVVCRPLVEAASTIYRYRI